MSGVLDRVGSTWRNQKRAYVAHSDDERPIDGYVWAMGVFTALTAGVAALRAADGQDRTLRPVDVLMLGIASHKLARILAKDAVASPVRVPFTTYKEPGGPGEVNEEVRGTGTRHAVGELLTCPFCLAPWTATLLLGGQAVAPRLTGQVSAVFAAVTVADVLQMIYGALERQAEDG